MNNIIVRECNPSDYAQIKKLIISVIVELFGREPKNRDDYKDFKKYYHEKNGIFYIAEDEGSVVGTIAIRGEPDSSAKLRRMYVIPKYRKKGVGQKLFEKALAFCKNKGYKRVILCTYPEMGEAIKFYKKHGFKEYDRKGEGIYFEKNL